MVYASILEPERAWQMMFLTVILKGAATIEAELNGHCVAAGNRCRLEMPPLVLAEAGSHEPRPCRRRAVSSL